MLKISHLFSNNNELSVLSKKMQAQQLLQSFWLTAAPKLIAQNSFATSLVNGQLTILADSSIVANKIKLTQASLLTQLQNLQNSSQSFRECKVTAIAVKVQVKSRPKPVIKAPRRLSYNAARSLNRLADDLGDSALASKLKLLASKIH